MSEKPYIDIPDVIAAAISSAGPMMGSLAEWKAAINNTIPIIVSMMSEGSHQFRVATEVVEAVVFTAVYRGYELEETSKRCLVTIETQVSKRYPDGLEPIRTHRTDNAQGKHMRERLDQLKDGDAIRVWKAMESIDDETKVRVLVHFEKTWKKDQKRTSGQSQDQGEQRGSDPEEPDQVPSPPARLPLTDEIGTDRLKEFRRRTAERLGPEMYGDLVLALESQGYDINGVSEVEWDEVVRPMARTLLDK